ncbi:hypothetical protein ACFSDA_07555 [Brachybacterium rhamnosum]|uniref:Uncharacterized protein n=1 Tax=Brachybacterium rhamnosum TaxID=173361 RepID=A0ABW4PZR2_9MICO
MWNETNAGRTSLGIQAGSLGETAPFPRELILDTRVDVRPPDRLWVAAALCFGTGLAGTWDASTLISTQVRAAVGEFLGPDVPFNPTVSDDAYQWYPGGGSAMVIAGPGSTLDSNPDMGNATFVIELRELGDWAGRLYSIDRLVTATNAFLHASTPGTANPVGPYLGTAVLLATELHMDQLILDLTVFDEVDPQWWSRAVRLCAAVGIDLQTHTTDVLTSES